MTVLLVIAAVACGYIVWRVDPAWTISVALVLSVFSGQWDAMGLPAFVTPDRFLLAAGIGVLLLRGPGAADRPPLRWRTGYTLLAAATAFAVASALASGTLLERDGLYRLLDRFGIVPFAMFVVAPLAFRTEQQRRVLVGALAVLGGYLGITALLETVGPRALLLPAYIDDPAVGIHFERARGPFVEAESNGIAMVTCAVAAVVAAAGSSRPIVRWLAGGVVLLSVLGAVFTLSRAVWLGAAAAVIVGLLVTPRLRRYFAPAVLGAALAVGAALLLPGVLDEARERATEQEPLWTRRNLDAAALRIAADNPLVGIGWNGFVSADDRYFRQAEDFPLFVYREPSHNIFLSNLAELGGLGTLLWLAALLGTLGVAMLRRSDPELEPWRHALIVLFVMWLVVGAFNPLARPFVGLALWTWAGVVYGAARPATAPVARPGRPPLPAGA